MASTFHTPQPHTPARPEGSSYFGPQRSKSVRWGDQQQQQQQQQGGPAPATSSSSSSLIRQTPQQSQQQQTPPQQIATRTSTAAVAAIKPQPTSSSQTATVSGTARVETSNNPPQPSTPAASKPPPAGLSVTALRTRIKWNAGALLALIVIPRVEPAQRLYWSLLDVTYTSFGSRSDERIDAVVAWANWAAFIVVLINLVEASVQLSIGPKATSVPPIKPNGLARPPGSVQMPLLPSPARKGPSAQTSSSAVRYSPHSPLKANLQAAGRTASGPLSQSPQPLSGIQRRLPSGPPSSMTGGASPLAAYLARRAVSRDVSSSFDASRDGDVGDSSSDSIEVDRALRVLSGNFARLTSDQHQLAKASS